ncbi:hypothetical protein DFH06DRAFT_765816 [Mycena polygramma]|nr:hypothetical protein DFH06DRAFT_765816 [Mycena polygramma]
MPPFLRLLAMCSRRLGSTGSISPPSSSAFGNPWRRHMSELVHSESSQPTTPAAPPASPTESLPLKPKKQRKPLRSDAQIAEDEAAAAALVEKMTSKETLERALDALTPRVSEAFKLAAFTELSLDEICEKMRPGNPMHRRTVGNYFLKAFDQTMDFDAQAALFHAIGIDKLTYFVRGADWDRWSRANGYDAYMTNQRRVGMQRTAERKRVRLVKAVENGDVRGEQIEVEKHKILWGWTKGDAPSIPRQAAAQMVSSAVAERLHLDSETRIALRNSLRRSKDLLGLSADGGLEPIFQREVKKMQSVLQENSEKKKEWVSQFSSADESHESPPMKLEEDHDDDEELDKF